MGGLQVNNGLDKYLQKVMPYKRKFNADKILRLVANISVDIASAEYEKTGVKPQFIQADISEQGVELMAKGEHLAFSEYGTGVVGSGTYEGELPTQTLKFESPQGVEQSTEGWQYNYRKEQGQTDKDWTGFVANAQMFKTSRRLQEELPSEIRKEIKGEN